MAHENDDDDDIEQHLLERIKHTIDQGGPKNLVTRLTRLATFESEFEPLWKTLSRKANPDHGDAWSSLRRENIYYLNNLLTEWQIIKKQSSLSSKEIYESCENIKRSLKKIKTDLSGDKKGDSVSDRSVSHHQDPKHPLYPRNKEEVFRWSSRHGPRKVHGFEHKVMAMEREMVMKDMDASLKVFGVVGVAGIGKTALCQTIFGRPLVKQHFSPRIWVCLSKQPRRYNTKDDESNQRIEIVVRMLECLGLEDEVIRDAVDGSDPLQRLILLLRLQLIGRRYLIIFDDAWDNDKFFLNLTRKPQLDDNWGGELAYALPKGCGGTVISSSRSEALLKEMLGKDVRLQYLKPQTKEIIDEIFKDTVTGYDEDEREFGEHLKELEGEIRKKCDGIPLAAKLLAKIAREQLPLKVEGQAKTSAGGGVENRPVSSTVAP